LHARSQVGKVESTEHSITFYRDKRAFTGVYFPLTTLDLNLLSLLLSSFGKVTAVLGDVNTRFRDPLFQSGEPGPPERLRVFKNFVG
jgi:hypothetical protein